MELLSYEALWGICYFLTGIVVINKCSTLDHKNHYKMRDLRKLEWYGRREADAMATLPMVVLGSAMTFAGSALSLYGLIQFLGAVL